MTAIWQNDGDSWKLLNPVGFPAEAALHDLVAQSPEMLPLSGNPRLAVLGREVQLGTGYADILAIEDNGRLVVIEVKLAKNSEARRAVVAQVLAYAAYLHGMSVGDLEAVLKASLRGGSIRDAVDAALNDLRDWSAIEEGMSASLAEGWFRLVLVLDEAPDDLVRLVGYLEGITNEQIIVDLITVASYAVNGTKVVIPRRIDSRSRESVPREKVTETGSARAGSASAPVVQGASAFEEFFPEVSGEYREKLGTLTDWARQIEAKGHAQLRTTLGRGRRVLRLQVPGEVASIVAIWAEKRRPGISFHTSVAARRAPVTAAELLALLPNTADPYLGIDEIGEELLSVAAAAYAEASLGRLTLSGSTVGADQVS